MAPKAAVPITGHNTDEDASAVPMPLKAAQSAGEKRRRGATLASVSPSSPTNPCNTKQFLVEEGTEAVVLPPGVDSLDLAKN